MVQLYIDSSFTEPKRILIMLQTFPANTDRNTIVVHILNPPIVTRVVRIMPKTWRWYPALRAEFYGCRPGIVARLD